MAKTYTLSLISDLNEIDRLTEFVNRISNEAKLNHEKEHQIMLVLSEAVTNAILHGNKRDPEKTVELTAKITSGTITLTVADQGAGFDYNKVPDPRKQENLLKTGGRGVWLIREFADRVAYFDNGSKIEIVIDLKQ